MHNILEKLSHGNYTISNEVATVNRGLFINDKSAEAYIELKQQQLEEALENGDA